MADIIRAASRSKREAFSRDQALYQRLARDGQKPIALVVACADSRVAPELIAQTGPGELFVRRNAGDIVPPFARMTGGAPSAAEYGVTPLEVTGAFAPASRAAIPAVIAAAE